MDNEDEPGLISDLMDLTGVELRQVDDIPPSDLLGGLRRILQEAGDLTEQYSAFDNFTEPRQATSDPDRADPIR
jgi:FXSXX-COOH protein